MKGYSNSEPPKFGQLSKSEWAYNWNIQKEKVVYHNPDGEDFKQDQYSYDTILIKGDLTYEKCIEAVIRERYTVEEEIAIINKYNSYMSGLIEDSSIVTEYRDYLMFINDTKSRVASDMEIEVKPGESKANGAVRLSDLSKFVVLFANNSVFAMTDEESLSVKSIYPNWEDLIGLEVKVGDKLNYNGKLFKVLQAHTVSKEWEPRMATASLYTEIVENSAGTVEDPIDYDGNMALEMGKYYRQNNVIYYCNRDTQNPVYQPLSDLVGIYVEIYS